MSARAPYGGHGHRLGKRENHQWLKSHGIIPVAYGDGAADRIKAIAPGGVDAFIDTHGGGYVDLALAIGVAADRIDTIADYAAAQKYGVKTDGEAEAGPGARVLAELAGLITRRSLPKRATAEVQATGSVWPRTYTRERGVG